MNRRLRLLVLGGVVALVALVGTISAALTALVGAGVSCGLGGGTALAAGPAPTGTALHEIPAHWLAIYREAGSTLDISWPFLASIGYQECGDGAGDCYVVNPSGCAGPMEIAYVRGSECSPDKSVPTIWERFKTDGNGDGKTSIFNDADAVFTAAKILREDDGAPPVGGSYSEYHEAACNYYGACDDPSADYADEVMARAVGYGFGHPEAEAPSAESGPGSETEGSAAGGGQAPAGTQDRTEPRGGRHNPRSGEPRTGEPASTGRKATTSGPTCEAGGVAFGGADAGEIVSIARSQIGYREHGDNCQKYGPCEEWCALFVWWVWERAGLPVVGGPPERAYSGSFYEWVKEHGGRDLPATATPAPGDAVMYGEGREDMAHVGIVERVFPGGEITTIEGNFADDVEEVGPFEPAEAAAAGEPAPVFAYAEPPGVSNRGGTGGIGS